MYLQDVHTALHVRKLHRNSPVKTSRPQEGGIQLVGLVGGCQHDDALRTVKAVHLRKELIQGLLPFVVSSVAAPASLLADGVDLVDEDDTGGFFLRLLKKVPYLGGAHTHEHLHEFRTGNGEEGHIRFSGHSLCQEGLTGSRRAHQKGASGDLCADALIFARVVQEVHHLRQKLLGLVLSGHVLELHAGGVLLIKLCVGLAHAPEEASASSVLHGLGQPLGEPGSEPEDQDQGQHVDQEHQERGHLRGNVLGKMGSRPVHPVHFAEVADAARLVDLSRGILQSVLDGGLGQIHLIHILLVQLRQEFVIAGLDDTHLPDGGKHQGIQEDHDHKGHHRIDDHGGGRLLDGGLAIPVASVVSGMIGVLPVVKNVS